MKIEITETKTLKISDLMESEYRLDPITVYLQDYEPGKGKITIECYGKSWSSFWGGMSGDGIAKFFCRCDNHYLTKNLTGVRQSIEDESKLVEAAKKRIIELRKEERGLRFPSFTKEDARDYWEEAEKLDAGIYGNEGLMHELFGDEWWYAIPEKTNPEWSYVERIVGAVKEALKKAELNK